MNLQTEKQMLITKNSKAPKLYGNFQSFINTKIQKKNQTQYVINKLSKKLIKIGQKTTTTQNQKTSSTRFF